MGRTQNLKLYPVIISLYTELYKQATLRSKKHTYTPNTQEKLLICKFIGWLAANYNANQIGIDFLISYFEFQFNRYIGVVTPGGGRNDVRLTWLIGPKAIKEWNQRVVGKKKFIKYRISKNLQLQLGKTFAAQKQVTVNKLHNNMLTQINQHEEIEKERYHNTQVGYLHCADMSTLYNPLSNWCNNCHFREDCIKRLKNNYPKIYQARNIKIDL